MLVFSCCLFLLQITTREECKGKKQAGDFFHYLPKYGKVRKVRVVLNAQTKRKQKCVDPRILCTNLITNLITRKMQCLRFCCAAPVCPFTGEIAKIGLTLHSMAGSSCQNVLVCVFSALSKVLFLSYLLPGWDNSTKDRDKCSVSAARSVASFCESTP